MAVLTSSLRSHPKKQHKKQKTNDDHPTFAAAPGATMPNHLVATGPISRRWLGILSPGIPSEVVAGTSPQPPCPLWMKKSQCFVQNFTFSSKNTFFHSKIDFSRPKIDFFRPKNYFFHSTTDLFRPTIYFFTQNRHTKRFDDS